MVTVELAELAIDLRLRYKVDTELRWESKYPLTVFRSRQAESVKIKYDSILHTYTIGVIGPHEEEVFDDVDDFTEYEKGLSRNDTVVEVVRILGM